MPAGAILITRPEPGASETAARLDAAGWRPVIVPFLHVQPCPARLPPPGAVLAVLAASGNAAEAVPASHHGVPLLAVGDATAARARVAGFIEVHSAAGDASALAALAARLLDPARGALLLACGAGQGSALATMLRRHGFRVHRRAVYIARGVRRFPPAAAVALSEGLRAALFFSAETARVFARLLPRRLLPALADVEALVIGSDAAAALQHLPWRGVRVAVRPTQDGVLALL
ncbi:MAG: uroporphyrinogen-III synthase [Acetobacteraceae bacterium]